MAANTIAANLRPEAADPNKLAMALFLISEGTFFAFLITAYVFFHGDVKTGPNASNSLDPLKAGIYTTALLASSFTMRRAETSLRRASPRSLARWLAVTLTLGAVFLIGQAREYVRLYQESVTVSRNIFGTTFFTLTGFHGLHVLLGLIALAILLGGALAGHYKPPRSSAVETIAMYWHFVDWVWVVIFSVIYLWAFF